MLTNPCNSFAKGYTTIAIARSLHAEFGKKVREDELNNKTVLSALCESYLNSEEIRCDANRMAVSLLDVDRADLATVRIAKALHQLFREEVQRSEMNIFNVVTALISGYLSGDFLVQVQVTSAPISPCQQPQYSTKVAVA